MTWEGPEFSKRQLHDFLCESVCVCVLCMCVCVCVVCVRVRACVRVCVATLPSSVTTRCKILSSAGEVAAAIFLQPCGSAQNRYGTAKHFIQKISWKSPGGRLAAPTKLFLVTWQAGEVAAAIFLQPCGSAQQIRTAKHFIQKISWKSPDGRLAAPTKLFLVTWQAGEVAAAIFLQPCGSAQQIRTAKQRKQRHNSRKCIVSTIVRSNVDSDEWTSIL